MKISDSVVKIEQEACKIYCNMEDVNVSFSFVDLSERQVFLNNIDKVYFSLFLAIFKVDCSARKIMADFGIDFEKFCSLLIDFDVKILDIDVVAEKIKEVYDKKISPVINELFAQKYQYYGSEYLALALGDKNICYSRSIVEYMPLIFDKYAPLCGHNLRSYFYKQAQLKNKAFNNDNLGECSKIDDSENRVSRKQKFERHKVKITNGYLDEFSIDLTAEEYITNPAFGRENELEKLIVSILTMEESPLLLGEAGVGKTAIAKGLAYMIQKGLVPEVLKDKKILSLNLNALLAGTMYRGEFEERVDEILQELTDDKNIILFIDEFHVAKGLGGSKGEPLDLINVLKPYLSENKITLIGATTKDEYQEYLASDRAFSRRFLGINIEEPTNEVLKIIINGSADKYRSFMGVDYNFDDADRDRIADALIYATRDKARVYYDRGVNPDLALSLLKKSFAYAAYRDHECVSVDDICEAILNFERLNPTTREDSVSFLKKQFSEEKKFAKCKVVEFSNYNK